MSKSRNENIIDLLLESACNPFRTKPGQKKKKESEVKIYSLRKSRTGSLSAAALEAVPYKKQFPFHNNSHQLKQAPCPQMAESSPGLSAFHVCLESSIDGRRILEFALHCSTTAPATQMQHGFPLKTWWS